jgi:DNA polymerase III subunit beta
MKIKISKNTFNHGLSQVQSAVNARTTLPILSNVLLEAKDNELILTTTDLDLTVVARVPAEVIKPGTITLPARKLSTIVRELPESEIDFSTDEKNVAHLKSGTSFFKVLGLSAEEFPPPPDMQAASEFTLNQSILLDGLKKTHYAISTDETRYVLNGVFHSFREGKLTMVATDGRRLAMVENEIEFPTSQETDFILPTKVVSPLLSLLESEGTVRIHVGGQIVMFEFGSNVVYIKVVDGTYPNYRMVIPGPAKHRVVFERETLQRAVQRVAILSSDKQNSIKMQFSSNNVDLLAQSQEVGEAEETIPVKYDGPEMTISFNPDYLNAPLKSLSQDEVYLDLIDETNPGVIRINEPFLYVIMPMRLTS